MANKEHVERLIRGVAEWNSWRKDSTEVPDLGGANLSSADYFEAHLNLKGANLVEADLRKANLKRTNLHLASLVRARLSGADLSETELKFATLIGADLSNANLRGAHLTHTDFGQANLSDADFSGACFLSTVFADVDLSFAKGLDAMVHQGPSTIGIDTIYRSGGEIPHVFLQGAGVPDSFIDYMGSLVGKPFEFHSCFISYSTQDQPFADRLHADLQAERGPLLVCTS